MWQDRERQAKSDSVDGAADHQLPLTMALLAGLIGDEAANALCALPQAFWADGRREAPIDIFVRRYTGGTRPWNPFHHDSAAVTVNGEALHILGAKLSSRLLLTCGPLLRLLGRSRTRERRRARRRAAGGGG